MMKIRSDALSNLLVNFDSSDKVTLFVYSTKSANLKKVDLEHLSSEQRGAKLKKWAQDSRFVAVVEKGDNVFAYVNAKFVEQLSGQPNLSINGKKVAVKGLNETESIRLSEVGQAIEEFIEHTPEAKAHELLEDEKSLGTHSEGIIRDYFAKKNNARFHGIDKMILSMANIPHTIKMSMLARWTSDARNEARRSREEDQAKEQAHQEIKRTAIHKEILHKEIEVKEIDQATKKKHL
jgi:hypothetical protein